MAQRQKRRKTDGLLALPSGATTVFAQMQISLNRIWGVVAKPSKSGMLILLKNRIQSLAILMM
jgi:membrane protein